MFGVIRDNNGFYFSICRGYSHVLFAQMSFLIK